MEDDEPVWGRNTDTFIVESSPLLTLNVVSEQKMDLTVPPRKRARTFIFDEGKNGWHFELYHHLLHSALITGVNC